MKSRNQKAHAEANDRLGPETQRKNQLNISVLRPPIHVKKPSRVVGINARDECS